MITEKTILTRLIEEDKLPHMVTGCKCDICGEDCYSSEGARENQANEYMTLKANWGYFSNHDLERWEAEVCEKCVMKHLEPLIKFRKRDYHITSGKSFEKDREGNEYPKPTIIYETRPNYENNQSQESGSDRKDQGE